MEARASLYTDETTIEGFGNTNPKKLVISAVNKMEKEGEAIITEIIALENRHTLLPLKK